MRNPTDNDIRNAQSRIRKPFPWLLALKQGKRVVVTIPEDCTLRQLTTTQTNHPFSRRKLNDHEYLLTPKGYDTQ